MQPDPIIAASVADRTKIRTWEAAVDQFVLYFPRKPWEKVLVLRACLQSKPNFANRCRCFRAWLVMALLVLEVTATLRAQELSAVSESLLQRSRQLEQARAEAARRPLIQADVRCGPWHCIGPFKDAEYGVFSREFDTAFEPEKDVVAGGDQSDGVGQDLSLRAGGGCAGRRAAVGGASGLGGRLLQPPSVRPATGSQRGALLIPHHHLCLTRGSDSLAGDARCGQGLAQRQADSRRAYSCGRRPTLPPGVVQAAIEGRRESATAQDRQVLSKERVLLRHRGIASGPSSAQRPAAGPRRWRFQPGAGAVCLGDLAAGPGRARCGSILVCQETDLAGVVPGVPAGGCRGETERLALHQPRFATGGWPATRAPQCVGAAATRSGLHDRRRRLRLRRHHLGRPQTRWPRTARRPGSPT